MTKKDLVKVATELNDVLGLSPEIDTKVASKELKSLILEAAGFIEPEDVISKGTLGIIKTLKKEAKPVEEEEPEEPEDVEEEEEEENEEDEDEDGEEDDDEDEDEEDEEEEEPEPPKKKGKTKTTTAKKGTKTPKETKKTTTKKETKKTTPEKPCMTHIMDSNIAKGGLLVDVMNNIYKEAEENGYDPTPFTIGRIRSHVKARIKDEVIKGIEYQEIIVKK